MKKFIFSLLLLFFFSISLQGCGSDRSGLSSDPETPNGPDDPTIPATPQPPSSETILSSHSLGALVDLGDYLNSPGDEWFLASTVDVNAGGIIIGESPGNRLIYWNPATPNVLTRIPTPSGGPYDDYYQQKTDGGTNPFAAFKVLKITNSGYVIGNRYATSFDLSRAFVWNVYTNEMIDIAPPNFLNSNGEREFSLYSNVADIREDGGIILTAEDSEGRKSVYFWDGSSYETITDLLTEDEVLIDPFDVPELLLLPDLLWAEGAEAVALNDNDQFLISVGGTGVYYDLNINGWAVLNTLPNANEAIPVAINNNKHIVGHSGTEGFFWDGGVMYPISNPSGASVEVVNINNNDIVIGNSGGQAFIWQLNSHGKGEYKNLGTLGGTSSTVVSINDRDEIIGYSTTGARYMEGNVSADVVHGFLWKEGVMYDIGAHAPPNYVYPFNPDFYSSKAVAISNPGGEEASIVTGISYSINNHARGFTLTPEFPVPE